MFIILIRSLILYVLVIFAVRLMGKRQLGELQPSELVITILISNIATLPLEDEDIPLITGVTPILCLVCFEVIVSCINLKFPKMRKIISGSPKIIVRDGVIDSQTLKELRFSADDLTMALRGNDIFDLSEVQFAVVETTGSISVMKKQKENSDPPQVIFSDGQFSAKALENTETDIKYIENIMKIYSLDLKDIFIITADSSGNIFIADNYGNKPVIVKGKNL